MPRVSRNYQHQDFSHLLTPQQVHDKPKPKKQKQPPVITPEKRHRDSLMASRKMRYVLSHTGKIHDRDCPYVAQIPDEAFDMCEDYPNGRYVCFVCYRKALVRRGLALDQTKYIDAAMRVFHEVGATNSDLNMLFLEHNAQIYRIEANSVYLKVNEDCWIVETATNRCRLYHNNYQLLDDCQRLMEADFHLQVDRVIAFRNALITMCQYTWEGHIQAMEAKRKAHRQEALRQRLSSIRGHQVTSKLSVFFRYFLLAVPANYPEQLPLRTVKREVHQFGNLCLCRVPKWKSDTIDAIENSIKTYCVENERLDYEQFCMQTFSATKEVI